MAICLERIEHRSLMSFLHLFALAIPLLAQGNMQVRPPRTLAEMRDHYRPLLIFAPNYETQTMLSDQVDSLQLHHMELNDRQIMLVPFFGSVGKILDQATVTLLFGEEAALRRRFHVHPKEFTIILLGKDGGEKFRSHTPISIEQLNQIVDAMPMRQQEMRSRNPE